jgi:hypothetical protein
MLMLMLCYGKFSMTIDTCSPRVGADASWKFWGGWAEEKNGRFGFAAILARLKWLVGSHFAFTQHRSHSESAQRRTNGTFTRERRFHDSHHPQHPTSLPACSWNG